jgi:hypothetical protein
MGGLEVGHEVASQPVPCAGDITVGRLAQQIVDVAFDGEAVPVVAVGFREALLDR